MLQCLMWAGRFTVPRRRPVQEMTVKALPGQRETPCDYLARSLRTCSMNATAPEGEP